MQGCHYCQFDPVALAPLNENTRLRLQESQLLEYDFAGKTVLDIGCNLGLFCLLAFQREARQVVGADITEDFIKQSRERADLFRNALPEAQRARFDVRFDHIGFAALDPACYRADVVLCYEVLHWLVDQGIGLADAIQRLRLLTGRDLFLEFPWDVTERSIANQTKLTREQYDAEIIFRELLKHFANVRILRFTTYMQDTHARRVLVRAN